MTQGDGSALPAFVGWSIFPFEGEMRIRPLQPLSSGERPRSGEPGGEPCSSCAADDGEYIWVSDHWRVRPSHQPSGMPVQLFLESRDHVDLHELSAELAGELGVLLVRLDRAVSAVGGIGRVHVNRWGDGGSHFHMWVYGRPYGTSQMLGFCVPLWAQVAPPTDDATWRRNLEVVANELARDGGKSMLD